jgi:hypothetical protein
MRRVVFLASRKVYMEGRESRSYITTIAMHKITTAGIMGIMTIILLDNLLLAAEVYKKCASNYSNTASVVCVCCCFV